MPIPPEAFEPALPDLGPEGNYPQIGPTIGDEINAMIKAYGVLAPLTRVAQARAVGWLSSALLSHGEPAVKAVDQFRSY